MKTKTLVIVIAILAAAILVPPVLEPRSLEVRCVDGQGRDGVCEPTFAYVDVPDRSEPSPLALLHDLAYAASDAGPKGLLAWISAIAVIAVLTGLWTHGLRCALRRALATFALGVPLGVGLLYASCFLEGRVIHLGPDARPGWVPASLHTQTDRTTGLLTPRQLVHWHYQRHFRVLNVSDREDTRGGLEARAYVREEGGLKPELLVLVGEEWHGAPDLVLVNLQRRWFGEGLTLETVVEGVRREGGASFVAHPWDKLSRPLEEVLDAGVDGVELVNGVIHGGRNLISAAQHRGKALIGVTDYKFGPHVNALTILPTAAARSPRAVVEALRSLSARVLYAVPGGAMSDAAWKADTLGTSGAAVGLRTLLETPRLRRGVWFAWLALIVALWWLATREPKRTPRNVLSGRATRILFLASCVVELGLPAGLSWQVRAALGPIPVPILLSAAAVVAIPLLASCHALARLGERA